jgi:large subunit ribosomal protein L9
MKVVFLEEVEGTARTGDVKNVADGFARNFLLPRKLAAPATRHYIDIATARATKEAKRQERLDDEARTLVLPKVDGQAYTTEVRVGEQGKLFGSVTARDIAELVHQGTGVEVEHRQVDIKEPIRELGKYEIGVKLTRNVIATISLSVEPLGGMPETVEEEAEAPAEGEEAEVEASAEAEAEAEAAAEAAAEEEAPAEAEAEEEASAEAAAEEEAPAEAEAEEEASAEEEAPVEEPEAEAVTEEAEEAAEEAEEEEKTETE